MTCVRIYSSVRLLTRRCRLGMGNHRRTGQHPFGGAGRVLPEWIQWGGGSSRNFPGSVFSSVGGGVVAEIFRDPYSVG